MGLLSGQARCLKVVEKQTMWVIGKGVFLAVRFKKTAEP